MVNYGLNGIADEQHCQCSEGKLSGCEYQSLLIIRFPVLIQNALNDQAQP